jgi:uncharacterized protein YodC (DUF2158 family)
MSNFAKLATGTIQVTLGLALGAPWAVPALADAAPGNSAMQSEITQLHEGDLVQLRSGGPDMTVKTVWGDWVVCTWLDSYGELQSAGFPIATIVGPVTPDHASHSQSGRMGDPARPEQFR